MVAPSTRRDRLRAQLAEEIKLAARAIVVEQGAHELTLAAIARRLGITPPAIYRYYHDLADIVQHTAVDIVTELVDQMRAAVAAQPEDDIAAGLVAASRAFRDWSITHRAEFGLLFGTPTPAAGSAQPQLASDWVRRLAEVWGQLVVRLWHTRPFPVLADDDIDPRLRRQLQAYRQATGVDLPLGALITFLGCWRSIYGAVCLEVFDHLAPAITDHEPLFELLLGELLAALKLDPPRR